MYSFHAIQSCPWSRPSGTFGPLRDPGQDLWHFGTRNLGPDDLVSASVLCNLLPPSEHASHWFAVRYTTNCTQPRHHWWLGVYCVKHLQEAGTGIVSYLLCLPKPYAIHARNRIYEGKFSMLSSPQRAMFAPNPG